MDIISVKATNFLSFKELDYIIQKGQPILIRGENLTDEDQENNGSGKSALAAAIEYSLLHLTSRKTTDSELVFWGERECSLQLTLNCPVREETLLIERNIDIKSGGRSQLSLNGTIVYSFDDKMVSEIDKYIVDWLGISKEDIQNYFLISKFKYQSFFSSSNTLLVKLIGRFSNSSIIDGLDKDILESVNFKEKQISLFNESISKLDGKIEVHKDNLQAELNLDKDELKRRSLESIEQSIEQDNLKIRSYYASITEARESIVKKNLVLQGTDTKLKEANKSLLGFKAKNFEDDYNKVDQSIVEVREQKQILENNEKTYIQQRSDILTDLREAESNIVGSVKCPKCSHEFVVGDPDVDVEQERSFAEETKGIIKSLDQTLSNIRGSLKEYDTQINNIRRDRAFIEAEESAINSQKTQILNIISSIEREKRSVENEISIKENQISSIENNITLLRKSIDEKNAEYIRVEKSDFDNSDKIKAINGLINECNEEILSIQAEIKTIQDEISNTKYWAFTFKEFQQYISSKSLKVLQGYANEYLNQLRSDMRVSLSGFKMKGDGTLSDKITATIVRDGVERNFSTFSGGERARLEASMILTIQKAINTTHPYGGLEFLMIDEVLESSDALGIYNLMKSFRELNKTILLTTQVTVSNQLEGILTITKENGVSKIN